METRSCAVEANLVGLCGRLVRTDHRGVRTVCGAGAGATGFGPRMQKRRGATAGHPVPNGAQRVCGQQPGHRVRPWRAIMQSVSCHCTGTLVKTDQRRRRPVCGAGAGTTRVRPRMQRSAQAARAVRKRFACSPCRLRAGNAKAVRRRCACAERAVRRQGALKRGRGPRRSSAHQNRRRRLRRVVGRKGR